MKVVTTFAAAGVIGAGLVTPPSGDCRPGRDLCQLAPYDQVHTREREPAPGRTMPQNIVQISTASSAGTFYVVQR